MPFRINDAVHHRIALITATRQHMFAEHALFHRAESFNRALRAKVARVGLELDAHAPERFKRVTQEQVLALGIDRGALYFRRQPRSANFQRAILGLDVKIRGHADSAFVAAAHDHERRAAALPRLFAPTLNRRAPLVNRPVRTKGQVHPDFVALRCREQIGKMSFGGRFEDDMGALEGNW